MNDYIMLPNNQETGLMATSVHPSITERQISDLVDQFYNVIRTDAQLGPVFESHIGDNWDSHLAKMKKFWRSVLLKSREYDGRPVPVHQNIAGLDKEAFEIWLAHFSDVASQLMHADAANITIELAKRIATSLWLSRFPDPHQTPPTWRSTKPK